MDREKGGCCCATVLIPALLVFLVSTGPQAVEGVLQVRRDLRKAGCNARYPKRLLPYGLCCRRLRYDKRISAHGTGHGESELVNDVKVAGIAPVILIPGWYGLDIGLLSDSCQRARIGFGYIRHIASPLLRVVLLCHSYRSSGYISSSPLRIFQ